MITGAVGGFVDDLFDFSGKAKEAARKLREAQAEFNRGLDDTIAKLRDKSVAGFIDMRGGVVDRLRQMDELRHVRGGFDEGDVARISALRTPEEVIRFLENMQRLQTGGEFQGAYNDLSKIIEIAKLEAEALRLIKVNFAEDNEVLRLRSRGLDAEADALAKTLERQRELTGVRDEQMRGLIRERHALEDLIEQRERERDAITQSAEQTRGLIRSLQKFKDDLQLSDKSTLSPTRQYDEARRQYDMMVALARGGDVTAAASLPDAARKFLEASRSINASSAAYASDFGSVLTTTQEIIDRFGVQLSVEERMLGTLERQTSVQELILEAIRDQARREYDARPGTNASTSSMTNNRPTSRAEGEPSDTPRQLAVLQSGFTQLLAAVENNTTEVREVQRVIRRQHVSA